MDKDPINLDDLLAAERKTAPDLPTHLMENILADAADVAAERKPAPRPARTNWLRRLLEPVGGYPALAGAMAAIVLGVFVGYSGTESLETVPVMGEYIANLSGDPFEELGLGNLGNFDTMTEG